MSFQASKKQKAKLYIPISVFLFMYASNDTVLFGTTSDSKMKSVGYIIMLFCTVYWMIFFVLKRRIIEANILFTCVLLFVILALNTILIGGEIIKNLYTIMLLVLAISFCSCVDEDDFIHYFFEILVVFATVSIVSYIVYAGAYSIIQHLPRITNENGIVFYFGGLEIFREPELYVEQRSYGIFREPGVYIIFLLLALIFALFFERKRSLFKEIMLMVAVILSKSTAGYIILVLVFLVYLLKNFMNNRYAELKTKVTLFVGFGVAVVYLMISKGIWQSVVNKLFVNNVSRASRFDSMMINVKMLMDNSWGVLVGLGHRFVEEGFLKYALRLGSEATDNTNTIFRIMATAGVLYILILLYMWTLFFIKKTGMVTGIALLIIFVLLLFNESIMMNPIIYVIACYGVVSNKKKGWS